MLGDAAHLSAPSGEGANLAMYDGAELGEKIAAHPDDPETAIADYEEAMFGRSAAAAKEGAKHYEMLAGENPALQMRDMLIGA